MNNRIKYLLLGVLLIGTVPLFALGNKAQTSPMMQILQPSSDAQSLGNFAEIPVDLYTGRTNINIPLFTILHNDIEVPISLSYHGGGIKVDDECGIVGLGWTLNAGGVVSRIVHGMPDELYNPGVAAGYSRLDDLNCIGSNNRFREFINKIKARNNDGKPTGVANNPTEEEKNLLRWMAEYGKLYDEGHFDTAPDNFIFSVQGLYGVFVNGKTSQTQSNAGCSMIQTSDGYQITDVNGFTYTFNEIEKQYYPFKVFTDIWLQSWDDVEQQKFLYNSAWWLSSIKSQAGDSVNFLYKTIKKRRKTPNIYAYTQYKYLKEGRVEAYDCNFVSPHNHFMDTVHHEQILLTEIVTRNCRVVFHTSERKCQTEPVGLLDSISLYAKGVENGKVTERLVNRYKFTYNDICDERAKLICLTQQGKNGQTQRYDFTYHSSIRPKDDEKDHWGYYAKGSLGTFPNKTYLNITPEQLSKDLSADRHANNEYADNNMLASITYPSGLKVQLTWEPHDFSKWSKVGGRAGKEYAYNRHNPLIYDTIIHTQFSLCGKLNQEYLSKEIYLNENQCIDVDLSFYFYSYDVRTQMDCVMNWEANNAGFYDDAPRFSIQLNGKEIYYSYLDSASVQSNQINANIINNLVHDYGSGQYKFVLTNPRTTLVSEHTNTCVYYHEMFNKPETSLGKIPITIFKFSAKSNPVDECNVGGVRIKNIKYYEGSDLLLHKEYCYVDTQGLSFGVLAYPPRYASSYSVCITTHEDGGQGAADAVLNDTPNSLFLRSNGLPYVLNSGGHIEYERVTEAIMQRDSEGKLCDPMNKIEYYYCTSATDGCSDIDDTNYNTLIPSDMLQLTSQRHQRGHLLKKVEYTDECKTTEYNYDVIEKNDVDTCTGALFPIADFQAYKLHSSDDLGSIYAYKNFGIVKYRVIPYNKRLVSQQTTGDKTNTYHAYTYANSTYSPALHANLPLTHTYTTSEGDTLVDHFTYLYNTNKIIQCITTKYGYVVDGYRLDYDEKYRVEKSYTPVLSPTSLPTIYSVEWEEHESYTYDSEINKVVEVVNHKTNIATTYLWSYGGAYPIAEISNATLETVKRHLEEAQILRLQQSYLPDLSLVDNLRNLLPTASIKTMTYEPLVGMTSYMDPKGYVQYYTYDDFGQIQEIYEKVGGTKNVLKHFDYQMKNQ